MMLPETRQSVIESGDALGRVEPNLRVPSRRRQNSQIFGVTVKRLKELLNRFRSVSHQGENLQKVISSAIL